MNRLKRFLSLAAAAAAAVSCFQAAALTASADETTGTTRYGVTTTTVKDDDYTTVTMTSTSKENTSGGSWFYIGKVEVKDELTSVTIDIGAGTGGSNATGGAKQTFSDETTGAISNTDYNTLFNTNAFVDYSSTTDERPDNYVTSNVKSNEQTDGYCYLYAWINNGGCTITVTAIYYTGDYGITKTETTTGNGTIITQTNTATKTSEDTDTKDWVYLGAVDVTDLDKVTITVPENGESNFAASSSMITWSDSDKGEVNESDYSTLFESSPICNNNYNTTKTNLCGTTQDVTSALTGVVSSGTAYIYGWLADATQTVTVTAYYYATNTVEFENAEWGSTADNYTASGNVLTYSKDDVTKSFYGYKATFSNLSGELSTAGVYDTSGTEKGSYTMGNVTISTSGETVFYLITDKAADGYTLTLTLAE